MFLNDFIISVIITVLVGQVAIYAYAAKQIVKVVCDVPTLFIVLCRQQWFAKVPVELQPVSFVLSRTEIVKYTI